MARVTHLASEPVGACWLYIKAIETRDINALIQMMTADYGQELREWRDLPDFAPFFDLWCESQGRFEEVVCAHIDGLRALVDVRRTDRTFRLMLQRDGERWRVSGECGTHDSSSHTPQASA